MQPRAVFKLFLWQLCGLCVIQVINSTFCHQQRTYWVRSWPYSKEQHKNGFVGGIHLVFYKLVNGTCPTQGLLWGFFFFFQKKKRRENSAFWLAPYILTWQLLQRRETVIRTMLTPVKDSKLLFFYFFYWITRESPSLFCGSCTSTILPMGMLL